TIRYYERIGMLPAPERSAGGQRRYAIEHLKRLSFVRRARDLGFSLDEVRDLLGLADDGAQSCAEVEAMARAHLGGIRAKIANLRRLEAVLDDLVADCAGGTRPHCPIIETLFREPG
ncbi:MAG: helix-turn-helix domain-containing protein, partial [Kiloniellales bacterium]